jgi:hypothetical protein
VIGSMLPDLIDKPLGHILLYNSIDYGRIYAHTGLFLLAVLAIGMAYRRSTGSWVLVALAVGVLSHLVLDSIWEIPVTLYYPLLGDFGQHYYPNYIGDSLAKELGSAYEWLFGASVLSMLLYAYRDKIGKWEDRITMFVPSIVRGLSLLLVLAGAVSLIYASSSSYNPLSGYAGLETNLIIGLVATVGGAINYQMWNKKMDGDRLDAGQN